MNKIYSKAWNKALGQLVVVLEVANGDSAGGASGTSTVNVRRPQCHVVAPNACGAGPAYGAFRKDNPAWVERCDEGVASFVERVRSVH